MPENKYLDQQGVAQLTTDTKTYVDAQVNTKQDTLIPGTNIKNVNGESILSPGDIEIPDIMSIQEVRDTAIDVLYPALPAPTDVEATDTSISFDAVSGAEKYEVYANGSWIGEQLVTRALRVSIDLTTLSGWNDLSDGTYDITVGATAEGYTRIIQSQAVSVVKETPIPTKEYFLTFSSPSSFTIHTGQGWDGILEYSTDKENWDEWDGTEIESGLDNEIYFRGIGNTIITDGNVWSLTGSDISCSGNIETLLDYQTVANGQHPTMGSYCYSGMFQGCSSLTQVPELPATTLAAACYMSMFHHCTSLTVVPELPATTLVNDCYYAMFSGCTSLYVSDVQAVEAPYEWRIPTNDVIAGIKPFAQTYMFTDCLGEKNSNDFPAEIGQQYIYYTQNPPIGSN